MIFVHKCGEQNNKNLCLNRRCCFYSVHFLYSNISEESENVNVSVSVNVSVNVNVILTCSALVHIGDAAFMDRTEAPASQI